MNIPVLSIGQYIITFSAEEEGISPAKHFIKECGWTQAQFNKIKDFPFFCARVAVWEDGKCLNEQFLGCCSYETVEQFYTTYKGDYFADMICEAFEELGLDHQVDRVRELLPRIDHQAAGG